MHLILMGFMGSGKSTVGKRLSYSLHMGFRDTDKMIEQKEGRKISRIFAEEGEESFRKMETELLREIIEDGTPKIYSLGGGTPLREENGALLRKMGVVIYLKAKPETVYERLKGDTTRPLLQCEDPQGRIRELLSQRDPIYMDRADRVVEVDGKNSSQVVREVESLWREMSKNKGDRQ